MLSIQVIAQAFCLILAKATTTEKSQLSHLRAKDEEYTKRLKMMYVTITIKGNLINVTHIHVTP